MHFSHHQSLISGIKVKRFFLTFSWHLSSFLAFLISDDDFRFLYLLFDAMIFDLRMCLHVTFQILLEFQLNIFVALINERKLRHIGLKFC